MQNKLFNSASQSSFPSSPARPAKNAKIKKERPSMEKTFFLQFRFWASRDIAIFSKCTWQSTDRVSRQVANPRELRKKRVKRTKKTTDQRDSDRECFNFVL